VDGSHDESQEPITHIVAVTPNQWSPFFLKEIHHSTEAHTADNILQHISTCEEGLNANRVQGNGVMSDNKEKMKRVCSNLNNSHAGDSSNVVASPGDLSHALQLVIGDLLKSTKASLYKYKMLQNGSISQQQV
jgi:hypothetical protein